MNRAAVPFDPPTVVPASPLAGRVLPLENGDCLTRDEFERRYGAMSNTKKAELIEGVVYMSSPVRQRQHGGPHARLMGCLGTYLNLTPGVEGGDNVTVRLDLDNEPQPDACLFIPGGGQAKVDEEGYVTGAPEFVAEVAASSVSYDLHAKLHAYRRNAVREYLVWRIEDGALDWFVLRAGQFVPMAPGADGISKSEALPGLWLDLTAIALGDWPRATAVVQQGLASPEHAAFVARLMAASAP